MTTVMSLRPLAFAARRTFAARLLASLRPLAFAARCTSAARLLVAGERGSAMIETIVVGLVAAIVIGGGSSILYASFAKVWLARSARESAVCLVSSATKTTCRRKLDRTLRVGLPLGRTEIVEFRRTTFGSRVKLGFQIELPVMFTSSSRQRLHISESNSVSLR